MRQTSTPVLRYLYSGPGHELQTVPVGHQAEGGEVRCHVLLNRFRGSPGTFCACGHVRLSHKESCAQTCVTHTLTPVIQTSHNSSCNMFLLRDKIKTEMLHLYFVTQQSVVVILLRREWLRQKFLLTVLSSWLREFPLFSEVCGGIPLFPLLLHFCGFQWPVILSHQPSLDTEKTPNQAVNPPGQQRPHPDLPGHAPAKPCRPLLLCCLSRPLQQIPPALCLCGGLCVCCCSLGWDTLLVASEKWGRAGRISVAHMWSACMRLCVCLFARYAS